MLARSARKLKCRWAEKVHEARAFSSPRASKRVEPFLVKSHVKGSMFTFLMISITSRTAVVASRESTAEKLEKV